MVSHCFKSDVRPERQAPLRASPQAGLLPALLVHAGIAILLLGSHETKPLPAIPVIDILFEAAKPAAAPEVATDTAEPETIAEPTPPRPQPRPQSPPRPIRTAAIAAPQRAPAGEAAPTVSADDTSPATAAAVASSASRQETAPALSMPGYAPILLDWLGRHRDYPRAARLRRLEGMPRIALTLDRSGRLLALTLAESSGTPMLDEAALGMAKRAAPFPPPVLPAGAEQATYIVPVRFALDR